MKNILWVLSVFLMTLENGMAQEPSPKGTTIIDIPADLPSPPSAEEIAPKTPFFATTTESEIMKKVQELEEKIEKLEKKFPD